MVMVNSVEGHMPLLLPFLYAYEFKTGIMQFSDIHY